MADDRDNNENNIQDQGAGNGGDIIHDVLPVSGMYENWFLEYASYVILERAVPAIEDGLKPVQRRILHSMKEMDDGRFNKVANVIGQTMQYHPHGDASIGEAIVNIGQKDLLLETQGNWGDVRTGDSAAAPRYIEARLSKLALEIVFNPETTEWQVSYDGRKNEPVTLPVKFPLLLAHGVEGIAVGLSTKILPHNFCELIEASILHLKNKKFTLYPDFATGGSIDVANYNEGLRGGKVRVRAKIEDLDKKTLVIRDIPFGTTTTSLIESIIKANDNGKIKIKKVIDNTAKDVEILIQLVPGVSSDITIDALYAFTECEISISPNACVIIDEKPHFISVNEILRISTDKTVELLRQELEIKKSHLLEKLLFSSLEKIFIEKRIYRNIEECETWEAVLETIDKGLKPYKKQFYREITQDDLVKLTEIKIKRISKFDAFKADELMRNLGEELKEVEHNLAHLIEFAIAYFQNLLKKYGQGRERKTQIRTFETISANVVAATNAKLYINRSEGFIGHGLKKDEYICDCSDIDDVIVFRKDGVCVIKKIGEKVFVGKDILYAGIFRKGDDRMVYNMAYLDAASGTVFVKRFQVLGITRDKEYDLTKGSKGSKILYFTANPNGEAETVNVTLAPTAKAKIKEFEFDFSELEIKARNVLGNILTKYPVKKIQFKAAGKSTLGGKDVYFDETVGRLNNDKKGTYIGNFEGDEKILVFYKDGTYEITTYELTNRYNTEELLHIEKFDPDRLISAVYYDGSSKNYFAKRFRIETNTAGKKFGFISENSDSKLVIISTGKNPVIKVDYAKGKFVSVPSEEISLNEFVEVKGWKAVGNKISTNKINKILLLESSDEGEGEDGGKTSSANPKKKSKDDQLGLF
ncbi:DNA topoisomerase IV subunit A [Sporocytophaga myxococcoides]|uniref:DNA topoisomerase IV subunit A n=1 Tax=Sporocytophaga myxococcoides TaxID=153721 RepID=A0A098LH40_9BACT|nr:DNA gyrase/topoisomerase IV subunit A [Sporocytophaga myxococcoides]GAL86296.1 DNA topoisomerase IV subunit A [Sporocytophaga myxococcoides]